MLDIRFRPYQWPAERGAWRRVSPFRATYKNTLDLLETELKHLNAKDAVIQAGFEPAQIRNDGWPRSGERPRLHQGVILSFRNRTGPFSFPCYRYSDWQSNLRAIALSLEALRAVDRYGVTRQAEQYQGWKQLDAPAPDGFADMNEAAAFIAKHAGVPTDRIFVEVLRKDAYRKAALALHPDQGGSHAEFVRLQRAMEWF